MELFRGDLKFLLALPIETFIPRELLVTVASRVTATAETKLPEPEG